MPLLRCPHCNREMEVDPDKFDPPGTAIVELACEECGSGDFASPAFFDGRVRARRQHMRRLLASAWG